MKGRSLYSCEERASSAPQMRAAVINMVPATLALGPGVAVAASALPSVVLAGSIEPPVVIANVRIFDGEETIVATRLVIEGRNALVGLPFF
jgi:hypothetical protein